MVFIQIFLKCAQKSTFTKNFQKFITKCEILGKISRNLVKMIEIS